MLHRRSLKRFMLISLALMGMAVSSANAMSINIDFGSQHAAAGLSSDYGAAALKADGTAQTGYWNQISSEGTTDLRDLNDLGTDIVLSLTGPKLKLDGFSDQHPDSDVEYLLTDNFYANGETEDWSIEILGLDEGQYNIYYYASPHTIINTGAFSINTTPVANLTGQVSVVPGEEVPRLEQGTTWDVLNDVSIGSAGLLLEFSALGRIPGFFHGLSGLQLVQTSFAGIDPISPVPVPAAVWLFGTAMIGMIGFGKRRKAA